MTDMAAWMLKDEVVAGAAGGTLALAAKLILIGLFLLARAGWRRVTARAEPMADGPKASRPTSAHMVALLNMLEAPGAKVDKKDGKDFVSAGPLVAFVDSGVVMVSGKDRTGLLDNEERALWKAEVMGRAVQILEDAREAEREDMVGLLRKSRRAVVGDEGGHAANAVRPPCSCNAGGVCECGPVCGCRPCRCPKADRMARTFGPTGGAP